MYYDWTKTFSFDAPVTMVVGARGVGKTFGLREQMLRDYFKGGWSHVEICRYSKQISAVSRGYFDKVALNTKDKALAKKLKGYEFRYAGSEVFIRKRAEEGKKKQKWDKILDVVSLTNAQDLKKQTSVSVHKKRVVMDEAILDTTDRYHDYLPGEYTLFANIVDTIARQQPGEETSVRVYLLGNSCSLINPYFMHFGITEVPHEFGYSWHAGKFFLLHYADPGQYASDKSEQTLAGKLIKGTREESSSLYNTFDIDENLNIAKKPSRAKFAFGVAYKGENYGIWADYTGGYYYVCEKIPKNTSMPVFALTTADNKPNYIVAKRANKLLQQLTDLYCVGVVQFESIGIRERFNEVLGFFGVR